VNKRNAEEFSEADERLARHSRRGGVATNANLYAESHHATELRMEMAVRKQAEHERAPRWCANNPRAPKRSG
jgi:hypothetical protein